MKDISLYFKPIDEDFHSEERNLGGSIVKNITNFPDIERGGIALIHVPEYRNMHGSIIANDQPDLNREELYNLYPKKTWSAKIYDLGTLLPGNSVQDTFYALSQVVEELVKNETLPIIIGGSQDLTLAQFDAYKNLEQLVNLVSIDSMPDFGIQGDLAPKNYLQHILQRKPNHLFNYSNIGTQSYLVNPDELELMESLFFDIFRLGEVNTDISNTEPLLRNADLVSIDMLSIRNSDFPRDVFTNPNGFYAEQICQLARYAGLSDKLTSIGLYNLNVLDNKQECTQLVAHTIWHVIDGINNRFHDFPKSTKKDYVKYNVVLSDFKDEIVFYKSQKSERWWIEIPYHASTSSKYERHIMVPCSYNDFKTAQENEVPNLWWQTYQKIFV